MKTQEMLVRMLAFARLTNQNETSDWTNAGDFLRLSALSRRLRRHSTDICNGVMTDEAYDRATKSIYRSIGKILLPHGLKFHHQTDPRGVALYVAKDIKPDNYTNGLALY